MTKEKAKNKVISVYISKDTDRLDRTDIDKIIFDDFETEKEEIANQIIKDFNDYKDHRVKRAIEKAIGKTIDSFLKE